MESVAVHRTQLDQKRHELGFVRAVQTPFEDASQPFPVFLAFREPLELVEHVGPLGVGLEHPLPELDGFCRLVQPLGGKFGHLGQPLDVLVALE